MSDKNERSVASDGSVEPVAWAVVSDSTEQIDCEFVYPDEATAGDVALDSNGGVVPLYRDPTTAVTASEREAIGVAIQCVEAAMAQRHPEEEEARLLLHQTSATLSRLFDRVRS